MRYFSVLASKKAYYKLSPILFLLVLGGCYWWLLGATPFYFSIPVQIDSYSNIPLIQMEIGEKSYQVKLDLGAEFTALHQKDLCEIDKKFCGNYPTYDVHGNKYNKPRYEVLGAKIYGLEMPKITVLEESPDFIVNTRVYGDPGRIVCSGRMGREIFEKKNFLLDFASSKIIFCGNFNDLTKDGYDLKNFIEVPFQINQLGICLRVETDLGEQILLLDTAASCCFLRYPPKRESLPIESFHTLPFWRSKKFTLSGCEFGSRGFVLFEMTPLMDAVDGVLGMDFLKEHVVYIDSEKLVAYVSKSSKGG